MLEGSGGAPPTKFNLRQTAADLASSCSGDINLHSGPRAMLLAKFDSERRSTHDAMTLRASTKALDIHASRHAIDRQLST
jgi:hypothetical protein